jgi:hypothetical protein
VVYFFVFVLHNNNCHLDNLEFRMTVHSGMSKHSFYTIFCKYNLLVFNTNENIAFIFINYFEVISSFLTSPKITNLQFSVLKMYLC